jgi:hypothetical protein
MAPYLTRSEALLRLEAYGLTAEQTDVITEPDVESASDDLDGLAPFNGARPATQARQFPRMDAELDAEDNPIIPAAILNWVALRAYEVAANVAPPIRSTGAGRVSVTYDRPKPNQVERRMERLIDPYLLKRGTRGYDRKTYPDSTRRYAWQA